MTIAEMRDKIRIANANIQTEILDCMSQNSHDMAVSVREQLYSGVDGDGNSLSPSYSSDPFFTEHRAGFYDEDRGHYVNCYLHPERYIEWKQRITPPEPSSLLNLPARPADIPNLH